MRIATLNIRHGGGTRVAALLEHIAELDADILALTEFRCNRSGSALRDRLAALGYVELAPSCTLTSENCVLLASRLPMQVTEMSAGPPGHEHRLIAAITGHLSIIGAYFPQREAKRQVFKQVLKRLPRLRPLGVLIGDFNTGKPYLDESGNTFSCVDAFTNLEVAGLVDAWRSRNPDVKEYSWFSSKGNGFRVDHAFCTPDFDRRIRAVQYIHRCRVSGATDHAALLIDCDG